MDAAAGGRLVTLAICAPLVAALGVACGDSAPAAECIKAVTESGERTNDCLPVAPESERVDLTTPLFTHPVPITNRLHPTSRVEQIIYGGHVDGKPFRTEVTLLPETRPMPYRGTTVNTALIQYVAYLDGRIQEVAIDRYAQGDDHSVWYFGEDYFAFEDGKVTDTEGTWVADDTTPAALIMPADPLVVSIGVALPVGADVEPFEPQPASATAAAKAMTSLRSAVTSIDRSPSSMVGRS